jgi:hypothetical protein
MLGQKRGGIKPAPLLLEKLPQFGGNLVLEETL